MGEVGSGKTVVALFAMLRAVEHGCQAALMAPTETLAEQHFATLQSLLGGEPVTLALLTGSTPAARRAEMLGRLGSGECSLVVGTHALIEDAVRFRSLAVVVVDEQHRFGVRQRSALVSKAPEGLAPHVLHMTATPIPRTLALCEYGDLDVTRLRELPRGRRPIETHVIAGERERARAYERIREECPAGARRSSFARRSPPTRTASSRARAATEEFSACAKGELRDLRLVLLHGQLGHREKQEAMAAFAAGTADVLIATTVIEVGVDVPNATVMLVENAERFGISQLHQLRGRVGRGEGASLCLLCGPKGSPRLQALAAHDDGFELAEIDLLQLTRVSSSARSSRARGVSASRTFPRRRGSARLARAARPSRSSPRDPRLEAPEHLLLAAALERAHGAQIARAPDRRGVSVIAGELGGRRLRDAARRCDAADLRACPRGALFDARRRWTGCACSTSSRVRGRSGSRRSPAGAATRPSSSASAPALAALRANLAALGVAERRACAPGTRSPHCARGETYDLVFLDPPYAMAEALAGAALGRAPGGAGRRGPRCQRVRPPRTAAARAPAGARAPLRRHPDPHPRDEPDMSKQRTVVVPGVL